MNRLLRFLLISILNILVWLLATLFRLVLLPLLIVILRLLRDLVSLSFRATVNGPTRFIDRLAGEWTERFHGLVDDRSHIYEVYQLCRFMAAALIILGWIIATLFTVELLRVVFGIFI
jgi:hypothetical protein